MKKIFLSVAAIAVIGAGAPAAAKNGNGHGGHKAHKQQSHKQGELERLRGYQRDGYSGFGADRGFRNASRSCPPGLAKKNNGCLPPGQAKKLGIGDRLPAYLGGYNVPVRYQDRYRDNRDYSYRYDRDQIYRVDRRSGLIDEIVSVLGL